MTSLDEIGRRYGTDKATGVSDKAHGYLPHYEFHFQHLRLLPIILCEIGVYKGASLKMWREYFPNARIIGIDIDPSTLSLSDSGMEVILVNQSDKYALTEFANENGPFDVIIDDGSHRWDHQRISLKHLLPFVRSGGFYVIEDIHTSYMESYSGKDAMSFVDLLLQCTNHLIGANHNPITEKDVPIASEFVKRVASVTFVKRAAILRMK